MTDRETMISGAAEHSRQIDAQRWLGVADLAARWGVSRPMVRKVPRAELPYLTLGSSEIRRYDPRDVESYENTAKRGAA